MGECGDAAGELMSSITTVAEYQHLQPVLELERYTLDTALNGFSTWDQSFTLVCSFADQSTYFTASLPSETNSVSQ
jgi:hypothetical protein